MNENIIKEENLIVDLNFFPLINTLIQNPKKSITKRDLIDLRDEIFQWMDIFKESQKLFLKQKRRLDLQIRKTLSNKSGTNRRKKEEPNEPVLESTPKCEQSIWDYIDRLYVPLPDSKEKVASMFKVDLPKLDFRKRVHWTKRFAEIAKNSSCDALIPKVKEHSADGNDENVVKVSDRLLSSLVPISESEQSDDGINDDKESAALEGVSYPTIHIDQDPYLRLGFEERLILELENAGFSRFEEQSCSQIEDEINKLNYQLQNEVTPNLQKYCDELISNLPSYLEQERQRKENMQFLMSKLKKK